MADFFDDDQQNEIEWLASTVCLSLEDHCQCLLFQMAFLALALGDGVDPRKRELLQRGMRILWGKHGLKDYRAESEVEKKLKAAVAKWIE